MKLEARLIEYGYWATKSFILILNKKRGYPLFVTLGEEPDEFLKCQALTISESLVSSDLTP